MRRLEALDRQFWDMLERRRLEHSLELETIQRRVDERLGLHGEAEVKREEDYLRAVKGFKLRGFEGWGYDEPPVMRRIYPPMIPRATTDWDFSQTDWTLDTGVYVSPPSSWRNSNNASVYNLCKYAGTTNLPEGRIVSDARWANYAGSIGKKWYFRNQVGAGSINETNTYRIISCWYGLQQDWVTKIVGGTPTTLANYWSAILSANVWRRFRLTWWKSGGILVIRWERLNGSWQKQWSDTIDNSPSFEGSGTNRCGIGCYCGIGSITLYHDDTELWSP